MSSKSRKSLSPWMMCEKCLSTVSQKDICNHENDCPPSKEDWKHNFINNNILYSTIEVYSTKELPKNILEKDIDDMVFISQSAFQLCDISIGDKVLLIFKNCTIVKTAWPTSDKSLTSVSISKNVLDVNQVNGLVKVQKFHNKALLAKEMIVEHVGKAMPVKSSVALQNLLRNFNEKRTFCINNCFYVPFYGKKLVFKIVKIIKENETKATQVNLEEEFANLAIETSETEFFEALYCTKWSIKNEINEDKVKTEAEISINVNDIGGYHQLLEDLQDRCNIIFKKFDDFNWLKIDKGILLYGAPGVGKTTIAHGLLSQYSVNKFIIKSNDLYGTYFKESDNKLKEIFADAKNQAPSILMIQDIDKFSTRKSNSSSEYERKLMSILLNEIENLQNSDFNVLLLTTTSKPDLIDSTLKKLLGKEFEITAPTPEMRSEILSKLLPKYPNTIDNNQLADISFVTHGFVAGDLTILCSEAAMCAIKRHKKLNCSELTDVKLCLNDFNEALLFVKPTAMKEVLIEVPNVKWSDIGGQSELKATLEETIVWPLKHPNIFKKMGIKPARGVLMFGPPGCSKTMIAKALATESKLNFIAIKGPELFSKWVGESEKAVRNLFRKASEVAPSIIFIDEIDAIGGERTSGDSGSSSSNVQERVLAQLLMQLDGVSELENNVTLVAATNRPDKIDKALLRPGRLDKIIYVRLPDESTRVDIFKVKLRNMPTAGDVVPENLAKRTDGYSGAEIQAVCYEAAIAALKGNIEANLITHNHFEIALSKVSPRTPASLVKLYDDYICNKL